MSDVEWDRIPNRFIFLLLVRPQFFAEKFCEFHVAFH